MRDIKSKNNIKIKIKTLLNYKNQTKLNQTLTLSANFIRIISLFLIEWKNLIIYKIEINSKPLSKLFQNVKKYKKLEINIILFLKFPNTSMFQL